METVAVIAPHPDDEVIGCGGTLLKHIAQGDKVHWIIATTMTENFSQEQQIKRKQEINEVADIFDFNGVHQLKYPTARLETVALSDIVVSISRILNEIEASMVYMPFPGDVHSDHRICFDAASAATKSFRLPSIKRILCYEAISETDFAVDPTRSQFNPNVFIDVSKYIDKKIAIMSIYESELKAFPFPRSEQTIRALANIRGSSAGYHSAEAFMLLKEREG